MSGADIDNKVMSLFRDLTGDTHLTIVLGAGASAPSGLPQWDELAVRIVLDSELVATEKAAQILLEKQDPTIVLEAARARAGAAWEKILHHALYGNSENDVRPSPLHLAAAGHLVNFPSSTSLATINFDTLLESAVLTSGAPVVAIGGDGDDDEVPTIHHLHGAVFEGTSMDPIVGYSDFAELVADPNPWQRRFLSNALKRGPLILAGTSFRDPDIRHWLHLIMRDENPQHRAFVSIVREGLGIDRPTFAAIDDALVEEWESIKLTALKMHDLTDVALILRELRFAGIVGYKPPKDRARALWDLHLSRFHEFQHEYSGLLATQAIDLQNLLGSPVHRPTLWIANGRGKLARWATGGTHFKDPTALKLIPTGHDSNMFAGESLASEEIKVKDVIRESRVRPTWKSVLAIPVFAGDGHLPEVATAVATFGIAERAAVLMSHQDEWWSSAEQLSRFWSERLSLLAQVTKQD